MEGGHVHPWFTPTLPLFYSVCCCLMKWLIRIQWSGRPLHSLQMTCLDLRFWRKAVLKPKYYSCVQGRLTPGEVVFLSDIRPLFFELPHLSIWPFANTWGMIWPNIVCFGDMYIFSMDNDGYVGFSLISIALFMRSSVEKRKPYIVSSANHWRNRYYVFLNWVLFQEEALQNRILSTKHIAVVERSHSGSAKNNYLPVMSSISRGSLSGLLQSQTEIVTMSHHVWRIQYWFRGVFYTCYQAHLRLRANFLN